MKSQQLFGVALGAILVASTSFAAKANRVAVEELTLVDESVASVINVSENSHGGHGGGHHGGGHHGGGHHGGHHGHHGGYYGGHHGHHGGYYGGHHGNYYGSYYGGYYRGYGNFFGVQKSSGKIDTTLPKPKVAEQL